MNNPFVATFLVLFTAGVLLYVIKLSCDFGRRPR
jgi:hypothetical protein